MTLDKILIVDDSLSHRRFLEHHLRARDFKFFEAGTRVDAGCLLQKERFDLVFLDLCLPDAEGLKFINQIAQSPGSPIPVVMSGLSTAETAVLCVRSGAFDYLVKPFGLEELDAVIRRAETFRQGLQVNRYIERQLRADGSALPGDSAGMARLRALIQKVAPTEATVLITGESGAGKERVAGSLHAASSRSAGPLIKANCAAIGEEQIEKELFGQEEGIAGCLQLAHCGTLVLEEISELPLRAQVKLLRVLQEHCFERPGCVKPVPIHVRLIGTTQHDLAERVARGTFRQDLFFRLNVFPLQVPPLRERISDLPQLAAHWCEAYARRHGLKLGGISEEAFRHLMAYSWPGNVRELENVLERAVILAGVGGRIEAMAFDFLHLCSAQMGSLQMPPVPQAADEPIVTLDEVEKRHVLRALEFTKQNRTRAASLLKISVRTLRNKLHLYRLQSSGESGSRQSNLTSPGTGLQRSESFTAARREISRSEN